MRFLLAALFLVACDDGDDPAHAHDATASDGALDTSLTDAAADAAPGDAQVDAGPADAEVDAAPADAGLPQTGEEVYRLICAACHGPNGEGTQLGYELQHPVRDFGEWVVRNGRTNGEFAVVMAPYDEAQVSDTQLTEIWDWLDTFPQPETGEALFLDYCANCHGDDGRGGVTGVRLIGEAGAVPRRVRLGENVRSYSQRGGYMPAFSAAVISDAELDLITEFVRAL